MVPGLFEGLIPATVLPMHADAAPDEAALRKYIRWICDQGVTGVAINVDTGETAHLTEPERVRVLEVVREELPSGVGLVAGVSGPFTAQAVSQARRYKEIGADALLVFPIPAYLSNPLDPEIPIRYHQAIARAGVPIILFQLQPALAGVLYDRPTLSRLAQIPEIVAIKEASFDARRFMDTVEAIHGAGRGLKVLTGNDNFIYESFLLGADGALIGFGAIMTAEQVELIKLARARDYDRAKPLAKRIQLLADTVFAAPVANYRARLKEALAMLGILESTTVREPLQPISDAERDRLRASLSQLGMLGGP